MEQKTMKAFVYHKKTHKYGLEVVPVPQIQKATDAIIKVTMGAICTTDVHMVKGEMDQIVKRDDVIVGHEFCGEIVEMGSAVEGFKLGDRVVIFPADFCGECPACKAGSPGMCDNGGVYGNNGPDGGQAEYCRIANASAVMVPIPDSLNYEDVLLLPDMLCTGYHAVDLGKVKAGDTVAIFGLGPVGICACLLAKKLFGAKQVIGVDALQERLDATIKAGGIDIGVNAAKEDALKKIAELTGGLGVNVAIDTGGLPITLKSACKAVAFGGNISSIGVFAEPVALPMEELCYKSIEFATGVQGGKGLNEMLQAIVKGELDTKFILTHKGHLSDIEEGYKIFAKQQDGCIKWVYAL